MGLMDGTLFNKVHFPFLTVHDSCGETIRKNEREIVEIAVRLFAALQVVQEQERSVFIEALTWWGNLKGN